MKEFKRFPYNHCRVFAWVFLQGFMKFNCCVLNCDFSDFSDSHDKSADHKQLKTENRVLTTQQFRWDTIFIEASTPQSVSYFPSEILSW